MPLPSGNNNFNIDVFIPERVVRLLLLLLLYRWRGTGLRGGGKSESKRRRRLGGIGGKTNSFLARGFPQLFSSLISSEGNTVVLVV